MLEPVLLEKTSPVDRAFYHATHTIDTDCFKAMEPYGLHG